MGDPIIYLHQCGSQKFFAGKQGPDALLLFYCLARPFCTGQVIIQFSADADHEFIEPAFVQLIFGQSDSKGRTIYRPGATRRLEPQFDLHFPGCYRGKGAAECRNHGRAWLSAYYSTTDIADAAFQCRFQSYFDNKSQHYTPACSIRYNGSITGCYFVSVFVERLNQLVFFNEYLGLKIQCRFG